MAVPTFIDIVDAISPLVTLGFGVYCAVNDTKPKGGELSRSGKVALWGLIISGLITVLVKFGELHHKYLEAEKQRTLEGLIAKAKESEKDSLIKLQVQQLREKDSIKRANDSINNINAAFQKAASDSFSKSIRELGHLRDASSTTLVSLGVVSEKQQATLQNSRRMLHPMFPLKVIIEYSINLKEFFLKNQSLGLLKKEFDTYLDTLLHYASFYIQPRRYGERADTIYRPNANEVDVFESTLPKSVLYRFKDL